MYMYINSVYNWKDKNVLKSKKFQQLMNNHLNVCTRDESKPDKKQNVS